MVVPEPNDSHGLWARVKPLSGWPDTNEDTVNSLAGAWQGAAQAFTPVKVEPGDIRQAWRDPAGATYSTQVGDTAKLTEIAQLSCRQLHNRVKAFTSIVSRTKQDIHTLVSNEAEQYGKLPTKGPSRAGFVKLVAAEVNRRLKDATTEVEGIDSRVTAQTPSPSQDPFAEFDGILTFITDEMTRNANSADVQHIRDLLKEKVNPFKSLKDKVEAALAWKDLVETGGPWDHKSKIRGEMTGGNQFTPIPGVPGEIRFDVWSNIHYGYVGTQAGFDSIALHTGANAADLWENGHTDPSDQAAVQIGIDLAHRYGPDALRPEHVSQIIMDNYDKLVRADGIRPL